MLLLIFRKPACSLGGKRIQIHLMLLLIRYKSTNQWDGSLIQIHLMLLLIRIMTIWWMWIQYSNTSHVTINLSE